ncbi:MAG TPA: hypothetical protein VLN61_07160, partial [Pseudolabrys sp.]|nr:hypothetical protein [Pseudolabrys sp.]
MAMNTKNKETQSDIEELLPWHAAGTFSRRDTQRIEEALARDPELAHHYALVREELGETIPAQRDNGRALGACDGKQAGLIASIVIKEKSASGYETASAPSTDPGFGAFTIIRFAPQASSDDI